MFLTLPAFRGGARKMSSTPALRDPIIGLVAGSTRKESFNKKLAAFCGKHIESLGMGAHVKTIPLDGAHTLPIYNQDLEAEGFPEAATLLKSELSSCDAWVVAAPEYNGSMTPVFLNAVAWASRGPGTMYGTFKAKSALVVATSPGGLGGMRSVNAYTQLLTNLGVQCVPSAVAVGSAFKAFDGDGNLTDERAKNMLDAALSQLVHLAREEANRDAACAILDKIKATAASGEYGSVPPGTL